MKRFFIIFFGIVFLFGCVPSHALDDLKSLKPSEAKVELANDSSIILLDVRNKDEWEEDHLEGSLLIPLNELKDRVDGEIVDKNARIFVYCQGGKRSREAGRVLVKMGYVNVYDIGGIDNWP